MRKKLDFDKLTDLLRCLAERSGLDPRVVDDLVSEAPAPLPASEPRKSGWQLEAERQLAASDEIDEAVYEAGSWVYRHEEPGTPGRLRRTITAAVRKDRELRPRVFPTVEERPFKVEVDDKPDAGEATDEELERAYYESELPYHTGGLRTVYNLGRQRGAVVSREELQTIVSDAFDRNRYTTMYAAMVDAAESALRSAGIKVAP